MDPFFLWLIKSTFSLTALYIVFKLSVSGNKAPVVNRFVLLLILLLSVLLPFADISILPAANAIPQFSYIQDFTAPATRDALPIQTNNIEINQQDPSYTINPWTSIYLAGIGLLAVYLLISIARIGQIMRSSEKQYSKGTLIIVANEIIQPFSFFQRVIISKRDFNDNKDIIIEHEQAHIKHFHSIDILVCGIICILQWFNPFAWLMFRDLKLIHEYQADQSVLNKGINAQKYQLLILEKAVGERNFAMANSFSQKPILKRINMMQLKNNHQWKSLKALLLIPTAALLLQTFAKCEMSTPDSQLTDNEKYDVIVYNDHLEFFNQSCTLDELDQKIANYSDSKNDKKNFYLLSFNDVPNERIKSVIDKLKTIPDKKISTFIAKASETTQHKNVHRVLLRADGSIQLDGKEYKLIDFKEKINDLSNTNTEEKRHAILRTENAVSYMQLEKIKWILRSSEVELANSSVQRTWSTRTNFPEHLMVYALSWTGNPDYIKIELGAKKFISRDNSSHALLFTNKRMSQASIEKVKKILTNAGFTHIEIINPDDPGDKVLKDEFSKINDKPNGELLTIQYCLRKDK